MVFGTGSVTAKHPGSLRIALPVRHSQTMTCAMGELCPFENAKGRILTHGKAERRAELDLSEAARDHCIWERFSIYTVEKVNFWLNTT